MKKKTKIIICIVTFIIFLSTFIVLNLSQMAQHEGWGNDEGLSTIDLSMIGFAGIFIIALVVRCWLWNMLQKNTRKILSVLGAVGIISILVFVFGDGFVVSAGSVPVLLLGGVVYLLPAIVAHGRNHPQRGSIIILNVLLGWTIICWIVALIWASSAIKEKLGE